MKEEVEVVETRLNDVDLGVVEHMDDVDLGIVEHNSGTDAVSHSEEEFDNYLTVQSKKELMPGSETDDDIMNEGDITGIETGKSSRNNKQRAKLWKRIPGFGFLLVLLSVLLSNGVNVIVKEFTEIEPSALLLYRSIITTSIAMPWAVAIDKAPFPPELKFRDKGLLLLRGFLSFINVMTTIYSVRYMNLGDQKMLTATRPVFVTISARLFLKEKAGLFAYLSMVFMLVGIVFVVKPPFIFGLEEGKEFDPREMYSALAVIIATVLSSNNPVILRKLRKEHVISLSATNHLFFLLESFIFVMLFCVELYTPTWTDKLKLIMIAIGAFFSGLLYNLALKLEKANKTAIIQISSGIVVAFTLQILYFQQVPSTYSIIGAVLVSISIVILTIKSFISSATKFHV